MNIVGIKNRSSRRSGLEERVMVARRETVKVAQHGPGLRPD